MLAECDVVHDEGEAFAQRLKAEGAEISVDEYSGVPHGFLLQVGGLCISFIVLYCCHKLLTMAACCRPALRPRLV